MIVVRERYQIVRFEVEWCPLRLKLWMCDFLVTAKFVLDLFDPTMQAAWNYALMILYSAAKIIQVNVRWVTFTWQVFLIGSKILAEFME